jgi:hypothetical protein
MFADQNQAILYEWTIAHLLMLKPDGMIHEPDPAPLSTEQIREVLEAVRDSESYERQTISIPDRDGNRQALAWGVKGEPVFVDEGRDAPHPQVMPYGSSLMIRKEGDE